MTELRSVDLATGAVTDRPMTASDFADLDVVQAAARADAIRKANAAVREKLAEIDARSVRPLRAILEAQTAGGTPDPADLARLADLNAQAADLRAGLVS